MNTDEIDIKYALSLLQQLLLDFEDYPGTELVDAEYYFLTKGNESEHYSKDEIVYMRDCVVFQPIAIINSQIKSEDTKQVSVLYLQLDENVLDPNLSAAALIKLTKKALGGLNLFFFVYRDKFALGSILNIELTEYDGFALSRWYDVNSEEDFLESFSASLWWNENYVELYKNYIDAIRENSSIMYPVNPLQNVDNYRDINLQIQALVEISSTYDINIDSEIERLNSNNLLVVNDSTDLMTYEEIIDSLSFIGSNRVSSYQLLLEAQELREMNEESYSNDDAIDETDDIDEELYDNPIEFAKYMEKRKESEHENRRV